jgi:hypothetical protein
MPVCSKSALEDQDHSKETTPYPPTITQRSSKVEPRRVQSTYELWIENGLTATVIGLTAQFIAFLFGLITEYFSALFENLLQSAFLGLMIGLTAFVLMNRYDQAQLRRFDQVGN